MPKRGFGRRRSDKSVSEIVGGDADGDAGEIADGDADGDAGRRQGRRQGKQQSKRRTKRQRARNLNTATDSAANSPANSIENSAGRSTAANSDQAHSDQARSAQARSATGRGVQANGAQARGVQAHSAQARSAQLHLNDESIQPWWRTPNLSSPAATNAAATLPTNAAEAGRRTWTLLGSLDGNGFAIVDRRGLLSTGGAPGTTSSTAGGIWSLDWWVKASADWVFPSVRGGVRQQLINGAPVVETLVSVEGGEVRQRAFVARPSVPGIRATDELVIEIANECGSAIAVALAIRPYDQQGLGRIDAISVAGENVFIEWSQSRALVLKVDRPPGEVVFGTEGLDPATLLRRKPNQPRQAQQERAQQERAQSVGGNGNKSGNGNGDGNGDGAAVACRLGLASAALVFPLVHGSVLRAAMPVSLAITAATSPAASASAAPPKSSSASAAASASATSSAGAPPLSSSASAAASASAAGAPSTSSAATPSVSPAATATPPFTAPPASPQNIQQQNIQQQNIQQQGRESSGPLISQLPDAARVAAGWRKQSDTGIQARLGTAQLSAGFVATKTALPLAVRGENISPAPFGPAASTSDETLVLTALAEAGYAAVVRDVLIARGQRATRRGSIEWAGRDVTASCLSAAASLLTLHPDAKLTKAFAEIAADGSRWLLAQVASQQKAAEQKAPRQMARQTPGQVARQMARQASGQNTPEETAAELRRELRSGLRAAVELLELAGAHKAVKQLRLSISELSPRGASPSSANTRGASSRGAGSAGPSSTSGASSRGAGSASQTGASPSGASQTGASQTGAGPTRGIFGLLTAHPQSGGNNLLATARNAFAEITDGRAIGTRRLESLLNSASKTWRWPTITTPPANLAASQQTGPPASGQREARAAAGTGGAGAASVGAAGAGADGVGASTASAGDDLRITALVVRCIRAMLIDDRGPHHGADAQLPLQLCVASVWPDTWMGAEVEVHNLAARCGNVSWAIRWHGARPALLWEVKPHDRVKPHDKNKPSQKPAFTLTAPGLDRTFISHALAGEALLAVPA